MTHIYIRLCVVSHHLHWNVRALPHCTVLTESISDVPWQEQGGQVDWEGYCFPSVRVSERVCMPLLPPSIRWYGSYFFFLVLFSFVSSSSLALPLLFMLSCPLLTILFYSFLTHISLTILFLYFACKCYCDRLHCHNMNNWNLSLPLFSLSKHTSTHTHCLAFPLSQRLSFLV